MKLAEREALQLGHDHIDTEHLLLGIVSEGEGVGAQVLVLLAGGLRRVRQAVIEQMRDSSRPGDAITPVLRPGNIVFDTPDPERLAAFWTALTGYERRELFEPYVGLRDPAGVGANLTFQRTDARTSATGSRCHIDLYASDPDEAAERAVALGAQLVRRVEEGDTYWVVLTDPDANEFCFVAAVGKDRLR